MLFGEAFTVLQSSGVALVVCGIIIARERNGQSPPLASGGRRV
jgi:hypothetical protein